MPSSYGEWVVFYFRRPRRTVVKTSTRYPLRCDGRFLISKVVWFGYFEGLSTVVSGSDCQFHDARYVVARVDTACPSEVQISAYSDCLDSITLHDMLQTVLRYAIFAVSGYSSHKLRS